MAKTPEQKKIEALEKTNKELKEKISAVNSAEEAKVEEEKKIAKAKAEAEAEAKKVAEERAKEYAKAGTATVAWRGRERTYDKETHGKDFLKLADQFAKKFNGEVK